MSSVDANANFAPPAVAIVALSVAAFCSGISLRVTDPLLPRLAGEFGVSLGTASNVVTAFSIAYGLSQLFFGPVGDRFGKYVVVAAGCAACAVTAALCALAPTFALLVMARLLAGATAAAIIPLSMAWIGDVVPYDKRQPVLARFLIGQILGLSAGVLAGGIAADHLSWRIPFVGLALGFVIISAVLFRINDRLPRTGHIAHAQSRSALARMLGEFRQVLRLPWARVVLMTVFLEGAFVYGAFAFIASHLHRVHGLSLSAAGSMVMLFGLGGFLFAAASSLLVRRLGEVGLARSGGVAMFVSLFATGVAPAWWWALPGCLLAGLGFYMLHNTLQTNATQMAPERRGAAVASFASAFFLGQSVGVAVAGTLVERVGTGAIIAGGAIGVLLVGLNFSRVRARALFPGSKAV
jgi:predicted MFS family arabinose efflux permease